MMWTAIWFVINMFFVASVITLLFMHRSVTEAALDPSGGERLAAAKTRRKWVSIVSMVLFLAMCASFLINMRLNG
ncbi:hypothetical protein [Paenibacillus glycanilyticus]|uniref:Uncharacterized protein n=1 Tax=Paenibacillus glycanilyticus TaxID=126569 RepID=A0ABQ6NLT6_9BACL|nr:hypothetical protein [Paenibacillus glycanilyticus]GMK45503.1 hypothetical protein PghCCS26_26310 [Paenibacillus glycanilyticus]